MSKTAKCLVVLVSAVLALAIVACWQARRGSRTGDVPLVRWGSGDLRASEEAYYGNRVFGIVNAWRDMGLRADNGPEGQPKGPQDVYLVIDAAERVVWIEDREQVLEEHRSELPQQMKWTVLHDDGSGANPLGGTVRLKQRGPNRDSQYPEILWLVGQRRGEYMAFHFNGREQGRTHISGGSRFKPYHNAPARKPNVGYYGSIVVSDAEYKRSRLAWTSDDTAATSEPHSPATDVPENRAAWRKIQRSLYRMIESQVIGTGFELRAMTVKPGPDFDAGHAEIIAVKIKPLQRLLGGGRSIRGFLKFDYLGDQIWYARSAPDPRGGQQVATAAQSLDLEFLVSAGPVESADRLRWLDKGRKIPTALIPDPKWKVTLTNGVVVEFIGICEGPSAGGPWWGPDGSPVRCPPCLNFEAPSHGVGDRRILRFVWRIRRPAKGASISNDHDFEDGFASDFRQPRDRYGVQYANVYCHDQVFEKTLEKTTLTLGADDDEQRVRFKNLPLGPGQDLGFEIERVE